MKRRLKDFIVDPRGQYNHPGKDTMIPNAGGSITMRNIPYPVLGIDDEGNQQMMYPDREYQFPGNSVYEIPMAQFGFEKKEKEDPNKLYQEYLKLQEEVNRRQENEDSYESRLNDALIPMIGKDIRTSGFVPDQILNNPASNYCIGGVCWALNEFGENVKYFSNSNFQDDVKAGKVKNRFLDQSEKGLKPGDILQFKHGEKGMPYHAYLVTTVHPPDKDGNRKVEVFGNGGNGIQGFDSYILGPDNKFKGGYDVQVIKREIDPELHNSVIKRNKLKEIIEKDYPNIFKKLDVDTDTFNATAFVKRDNLYNYISESGREDESIDLKESKIDEILTQFSNPDFKKKFMKQQQVNSDEYDAIVKNVIGIYGAESKFGTGYGREPLWLQKKFGSLTDSIGPFQINPKQLQTDRFDRKDFFDPVIGSEIAATFLAENLPLLRSRAKAQPGDKHYSENLNQDNYLEYLPYLMNQQGLLKGDAYTKETHPGRLARFFGVEPKPTPENKLVGDSEYNLRVKDYAKKIGLDIVPASTDVFETPEEPQYQNGGTFDPETDEFIGFSDELPEAQVGKQFNLNADPNEKKVKREIPKRDEETDTFTRELKQGLGLLGQLSEDASNVIGDFVAPLIPKNKLASQFYFNNYAPIEYPDPINASIPILRNAWNLFNPTGNISKDYLSSTAANFSKPNRPIGLDAEKDYDVGEEAWRQALGLPYKGKYIFKSMYKPSNAKNPDTQYYSISDDIMDKQKIIDYIKSEDFNKRSREGSSPYSRVADMGTFSEFIKDDFMDTENFKQIDPLQQFQISKAWDPEQKQWYASIYDKYDFNFKPANAGITPYEYYDRIYYYSPEKPTYGPQSETSKVIQNWKNPTVVEKNKNVPQSKASKVTQAYGNPFLNKKQTGGTFNPDTDEFIGFADDLPKAQIGGWLNSIHPILNPYNWGVEDYTNKYDTWDKAYAAAKKAGLKEIMWNKGSNPGRKNLEYAGTPRQEVGRYGVNGYPVDKKYIDDPAQVNLYPPFGRYLPGHIEASINNNQTSVDYSSIGNFPHGLPLFDKKAGEKTYNVFGQNNLTFSNKVASLPTGDYLIEDKYKPSDWNLFTNNCADNVCDAFGIPRSNKIETPQGTMDKIKKGYPTMDITGRSLMDYNQLNEVLQTQPNKKILAQANNILGIASSPEIQKSGLGKSFISTIQGVLANEGYDLSKSLREDGNYDGVYGPETKQALADWQSKNKNKKQKGGENLPTYQKNGQVKPNWDLPEGFGGYQKMEPSSTSTNVPNIARIQRDPIERKDFYREREKAHQNKIKIEKQKIIDDDKNSNTHWWNQTVSGVKHPDIESYAQQMAEKKVAWDTQPLDEKVKHYATETAFGVVPEFIPFLNIARGAKYIEPVEAAITPIINSVDNIGNATLRSTGSIDNATNVSKQIVQEKPSWVLHEPETNSLQIKSTMIGSPLEKQLSKSGEININNLRAHIGKSEVGQQDKFIIDKVLNEKFPGVTKIDYNDFRKAISEELVPLERNILIDKNTNWGVGSLGYPGLQKKSYESAIEYGKKEIERIEGLLKNPETIQPTSWRTKDELIQIYERELADTKLNVEKSIKELEDLPLENNSITYHNTDKFGRGSSDHFDENTLGHARTLVSKEEPDIMHILESQSDYWQKIGKQKPMDVEKYKEILKKREQAYARDLENLEKMKETKLSPLGDPMDEFQINQFEDIVKQNGIDLAFAKGELSNPVQKQFFGKNYQERLLQENIAYAAEQGKTKMRYPTAETAAGIQRYRKSTLGPETLKEIMNNSFEDVIKIKEKLAGTPFKENELAAIKKVYDEVRAKNGVGTFEFYDPKHQTILQKYAETPKMIKKTLGTDAKIVTDSKGNTWYEFDIPEKFRKGKAEIKALALGGSILGTRKLKSKKQESSYNPNTDEFLGFVD